MSVQAASVHTHSPDAEAIARLRETFDLQRAAFAKELYPELEVRKDRLRAAASMVLANRKRIADALQSDYATHPTVFGDVVEVLNPITRCLHVAQQLDQWAAEDVRQVDPAMFGTAVASSRYGPKGVIGNIVPWNFPFELGFGPMAEMLGAGNRVIIKPSDLTPACGELMAEMVAATFDRDLIAVSTGGLDLARTFSALPWDHLLYTGNPEIGREVALAAAENLTPLTVELGGKSPAVILPGGSTPEAARNVVGTKMVKNGQVCITVDYVLVPRAELDTFVQHAVDWVQSAVPQFADSDDCTGIITTRHLQRLTSMVQEAEDAGVRIVRPGNDHGNAERRQLPLTLVIDPPDTLRLMTEEIFGPILPIVPYDSVDDAVAAINAAERPLALYVFGADADAESVVRRTISGGVGINACAMQANNDVGFGGSGRSGYGRHHGIEGFREFSVQRGTFVRGENDAIDAFLPPYHGPVESMVDAVFEQLGELLGTSATPPAD